MSPPYHSLAIMFTCVFGCVHQRSSGLFGDTQDLIRNTLKSALSVDGHQHCSRNLVMVTTTMVWRNLLPRWCFSTKQEDEDFLQREIVSNFPTNQAVIDTFCCSMHIPGLFASPVLTRMWDGRIAFDGALSGPTAKRCGTPEYIERKILETAGASADVVDQRTKQGAVQTIVVEAFPDKHLQGEWPTKTTRADFWKYVFMHTSWFGWRGFFLLSALLAAYFVGFLAEILLITWTHIYGNEPIDTTLYTAIANHPRRAVSCAVWIFLLAIKLFLSRAFATRADEKVYEADLTSPPLSNKELWDYMRVAPPTLKEIRSLGDEGYAVAKAKHQLFLDAGLVPRASPLPRGYDLLADRRVRIQYSEESTAALKGLHDKYGGCFDESTTQFLQQELASRKWGVASGEAS